MRPKRTIRRRGGEVTLGLLEVETIENAQSLHGDLVQVFEAETTKAIKLDAAKTSEVDLSFAQLVLSAEKTAEQKDVSLQLTRLARSVSEELARIDIRFGGGK